MSTPPASSLVPTLFIASDHAGFALKSHLIQGLSNKAPGVAVGTISLPLVSAPGGMAMWRWKDLGPSNADRVDYPDYAQALSRELLNTREEETRHAQEQSVQSFGILICGSGQGMAMAANRFKGIRAALTWSIDSTRLSREHNDANILCLGARLIEPSLAVTLVETFLQTPFEGGRHAGRVTKIEL